MESRRFRLLTLLCVVATQIYGQQPTETVVRTDIKGRLLTPEEGCGYSKVANTRIVGGAPAKNGAWPWLVLLGSTKGFKYTFECGGSLITSRHVLTAAHCLEVPTVPVTFARLGEYDTSTLTDGKHEDINIAQKIVHEEWSLGLLINDIAILGLVRDVTFNDRIVPICLPKKKNHLSAIFTKSLVGLNPFIAGWGRTSENAVNKMSDILNQVQLPVIKNSECKQKYKNLGLFKKDIQFSDIVLCAGYAEGGQDSCKGDSGGPLMLPEHKNGKFPYYQIGINSYGLGCARPNVPGVYTNVRQYVDWIYAKVPK